MTLLEIKDTYIEILPKDLPRDCLVAFDFETHEGTFDADLLAFAWMDGDSIKSTVYDMTVISEDVFTGLVDFFLSAQVLVAHNMIFDLTVLYYMGVPLEQMEGRVHDTMVMAHIQDTEAPKGLKFLAREKLDMPLMEWKEASRLSRPEYITYSRMDSVATLMLFYYFRPSVLEADLEPVYLLELKVAWTVIDMQLCGILVDVERFNRLREEVEEKLNGYLEQLAGIGGKVINFNSFKQIRMMLYDTLKIVPNTFFNTDSGVNSTSAAAIAEILSRPELTPVQKEFCSVLLDYKKYFKLKSQFLSDKFMHFIEPDGRIRTTFKPTQTVTGRFSASDPNLQQIPKRGTLGAEMRKMFIAPPGYQLIRVDMSQIEYRILAHFTGDPDLIKAYHNGADLHQALADLVGLSRDHAKSINFGIVYGMGVMKLSKSIGKSLAESRAILKAYYQRFPGINKFKTSVINYASINNSIRTLSGRLRNLEKYLQYDNGSLERLAINTTVQGAAADLLKLSMVRCREVFRGTSVRMLLQVHDELVFECPDGLVADAIVKIQDIMENTHKFSVPLLAEPKAAQNWFEAA